MNKTLFWTILFFLAFLFFGLSRAAQRPLWNDEFNSLLNSTLSKSYMEIISGKIDAEGNNSPLFYILQKIQCDIFSYHPPAEWHTRWSGNDVYSQIFLRIQPVLFASLGICALFYYFTVRYSLSYGLYSVIVAVSSLMFWLHWTEFRPYALWFFLTIFQILLLLEILRLGIISQVLRRRLMIVHFFLAVTAVMSIFQVIACSVVLWFCGQRQWRYFIGMMIIPVGVSLFYYVLAVHYGYFFKDGPLALINANIPKDRLFVFFIFAIVFIWQYFVKRSTSLELEAKYFLFAGIILVGFSALLLMLKLREIAAGGFQVPARYFMVLTPVGIVGTTLCSIAFVRLAKPGFVRGFVWISLIGLLIFRVYKTALFVPDF